MVKAKYVTSPYFVIFMPTFFFLFCIIISLIIEKYLVSIIISSIAILWNIPFIIFRKFFFKKMLINEIGITISYKTTILKLLKWEDVKDVLVQGNNCIILSNEYLKYSDKEWTKNHLIGIPIATTSSFFTEICKYKNKIHVPIRNINKLNKRELNMLTKEN